MPAQPIKLTHNFDPNKFMWLYAKYAYGANPQKHCTNAIRGKYSTRFTRNNEQFANTSTIIMDEYPDLGWDAIYICGVSRKGYWKHENYPHNVHIAVIPEIGKSDNWEFEDWKMSVENGYFEYVIAEDELDDKYKDLSAEYRTCRMFRWAVWHYREQLNHKLITKASRFRV